MFLLLSSFDAKMVTFYSIYTVNARVSLLMEDFETAESSIYIGGKSHLVKLVFKNIYLAQRMSCDISLV